jgi:hypothetical protein
MNRRKLRYYRSILNAECPTTRCTITVTTSDTAIANQMDEVFGTDSGHRQCAASHETVYFDGLTICM